MANYEWIGSISGAWSTAANWNPGTGPPGDGDAAFFTKNSTQSVTSGLVLTTTVTISVNVEKGFKYGIGASGNPLKPDTGFTSIVIRGKPTGVFLHSSGGDIDQLDIDCYSFGTGAITVEGGTLNNFTVNRGNLVLSSGVTFNGRGEIAGEKGTSLVTIPAGCTLTSSYLSVSGGYLALGTTGIDVEQSGGELILTDSAGASGSLKIRGGQTWWDATTSTIALLEVSKAGSFGIRNGGINRTLTEAHMYDDGMIDVSVGGLAVTYTNGIRVHGNRMPMLPKGCKITIAA